MESVGILAGRSALVTGAASDIGAATCAALVRAGAAVRAVDLAGPRLDAVASRVPGCELRAADLTRDGDIGALAARPVDVLVCAAAVVRVSRIADEDPNAWEPLWQVNLRAPMALTQALVGSMTARGFGRLVYVSSDAARAGAGGEAVYAATKAGLLGFAKSVAREVAGDGVTANVVCPGIIDTTRSRALLADAPGMRESLRRAIPARTFGTPDDVAETIVYLSSPGAGYVTGQLLSVNGGIAMH